MRCFWISNRDPVKMTGAVVAAMLEEHLETADRGVDSDDLCHDTQMPSLLSNLLDQ